MSTGPVPTTSREAPAIVVAGVPEVEREVVRELMRRYRHDYDIISALWAREAIDGLSLLAADDVPIALVLVDHHLSDMPVLDLLGQVRSTAPGARAAVVVARGDRSPADLIRRAISLGQLDKYVPAPWREGDEDFHLAVTDLLQGWNAANRGRFEVVRVIGERVAASSHALRDTLHRAAVPFGFYDADSEAGQSLLEQASVSGPLPVVLLSDGTVLTDPAIADVAAALGANTGADFAEYDVVIVGAGPSGMAASVYAASEGLRTLLVEPEAIGGQAGTSSSIRNYLGFPLGVSGSDLTSRAYEQAWSFGVRMYIGRRATTLRGEGDWRVIELDDATQIRTRTVVLASGVAYRRLDVPNLERFLGRGVYYGSAMVEAPAMVGQRVFVVGGANSAGQAALQLAKYADQVILLVRGNDITQSMSAYLVTEIENTRNVEVALGAEIVEASGESRLEELVVSDAAGSREIAADAAFVLIGAEPKTDWLPVEVRRDGRGYVLTGADHGGRHEFETSVPGVFAVGDVRAGSVKRVAAAVGEGSIAIRTVHEYLRSLTER